MKKYAKKKMKNGFAKEVGPHQWNFHKFLKYLDDHDAEIKIRQKRQSSSKAEADTATTVYSSQKGHLSLRKLVFDACEFEKMSSVYDYTRNLSLKNRITRGQEFHDSHIDIIESVSIYFSTDDAGMDFLVNDEDYDALTKFDLYLDKSISEKKPSSILDIYPDLVSDLHKLVVNLSESVVFGKESSVDNLPFSNEIPYPFDTLTKKIARYLQEDDFVRSGAKNRYLKNFRKLLNEYKSAFQNSLAYRNVILPDYCTLECFFKNLEWDGQGHHWWAGDLICNPKREYEDFEDPNGWFNGYRYQKIREKESLLTELEVEDWPQFYLEHIILTAIECVAAGNLLVSIIKHEVAEHLRFRVFYSKDGTYLTANDIDVTIPEMAELLLSYNLPSNLESLININGDRIIEKPIKRYPSLQVNSSNLEVSAIENFIRNKFQIYLFDRIATHLKYLTPGIGVFHNFLSEN